MKRRLLQLGLITAVLFFTALLTPCAVLADEKIAETETEEEKPQESEEQAHDLPVYDKGNVNIFDLGVGIGANFYGIIGPRSISTRLYKINLTEGTFILGFTGGLEGLFHMKEKHSLSVGCYYEQRKINLKAAHFSIFAPLLPDPYYYKVLHLEDYAQAIETTVHYFTLPLTYRIQINELFYMGLAVDFALFFQGEAQSIFLVFKKTFDLKEKFMPLDLGGRVIFGFLTNRVFIEVSIGAGILDFEKYAGERRSISMKFVVGYRAF